MDLSSALLGEEHGYVMNEETAKSVLKHVHSTERRFVRSEAERLFFINETQFLGAVMNCKINSDNGIPECMLVGRWKYHDGIYVRAGKEHSLALLTYGMLVDIRTDCEEEGFFYTAHSSSISLKEVEKKLPLIKEIIGAVKVMKALLQQEDLEKKMKNKQ